MEESYISKIKGKEQCLELLRASYDLTNMDDKYRLYQVAFYYTKNFDSFTQEETREIISNARVMKKLQGSLFKDLLLEAKKKERLLPQELFNDEKVLDNSDCSSAIQSYIQVVEDLNSEQIEIFYKDKKFKNFIKSEFINMTAFGRKQSPRLTETVMKNNPTLWGYNREWSTEEILDFLRLNHKKEPHLFTLSIRDNHPRMKEKEIKEYVWTTVIKKSTAKEFLDFYKLYKSDFLAQVQNKMPQSLKEEIISDINNIKFLFQYHKEEDFELLVSLFKGARHELSKPVTLHHGVFLETIPGLKKAMMNNNYHAFYLYSQNLEELNVEEKEYYAATCLNALINKDIDKNISQKWIKDTLENFDFEILNKFIPEAKNKISPEEGKMLEALVLKRHLDETLALSQENKKENKNMKQEDKDYLNKEVKSIKECLDIVKDNTAEELTNKQKYDLYLSKKYFLENSDRFSFEEASIMLTHPMIKKVNNTKIAKELFQDALKKKKIFPIALEDWFKKGFATNQELIDYIHLLNETPDIKQLKLFFQRSEDLVKTFYVTAFKANIKIDETFHKVVLDKEPSLIVFNQDWDENKIIDFLENKKKLAKKILINAFVYKAPLLNQEKVCETLYEIGLEELKNSSHFVFLDIMRKAPVSFFEYIKSRDYEFFKNTLTKKVAELPYNNVAQEIVEYNALDINENKEIFKGFESILLQPMRKKVQFHETDIHPFEWELERSKYRLFMIFTSQYDNLNDKEKEFFKAIGLSLLMTNQIDQERIKISLNGLHSVPVDELKELIPVITKNDMYFNEEAHQALNSLILKKDLDNELPHPKVNDKEIKRPKI